MHYPLQHTKIEEDRCIKTNCIYEKTPGSDYCSRHGANKDITAKTTQSLYQFKLDRVRRRTDLLAIEPTRYKLDEELAILRLTLEDTVNKVTSSDDEYALFSASDTIKNTVMAIEKLVGSCVTQSKNLKLLFTHEDLREQVQMMIDIIAEEIEDEDTIIRIAHRVADSLIQKYDIKRATCEDDEESE